MPDGERVGTPLNPEWLYEHQVFAYWVDATASGRPTQSSTSLWKFQATTSKSKRISVDWDLLLMIVQVLKDRLSINDVLDVNSTGRICGPCTTH